MKNQPLSIEDIPVFLAFAYAPNAARAAIEVGLSQPAFNQRLRKMDAEIKPSLFAWNGNKRVLSAFGEKLLQALEPRVQTLMGAMDAVFEHEENHERRPLKVAGRSEVFSRLSENISSYKHDLSLQSCSSRMALELVERGDVDVAISVVKPAVPHLVIRKLFTSQAVLAVPEKLVRKSGLKPGAVWGPEAWPHLQKLPWLAYSSSDKLFIEFLHLAKWSTKDVHVRIYCDNWQALWRFVKAGEGCVVLPVAYVEETDAVMAAPPIPNFQQNPFYLVCQHEKAAWPRVREFFEFAKESLR